MNSLDGEMTEERAIELASIAVQARNHLTTLGMMNMSFDPKKMVEQGVQMRIASEACDRAEERAREAIAMLAEMKLKEFRNGNS